MPIGWKVIEPPTSATITAKTKKPTFSGTGQQPQFGPLFTSTKKLQASLSARVDPAGGIVAKTKKCTFTGAGKQTQIASMGMGLKKLSFAGSVTNQGVLGSTVKKTAFTGADKQQFTGALGAALKRAKATIQAAQIQSGVMAAISKRVTATMAGTAPLILTNTLSGSSFDTNFWGQNSGTGPGPGVYLSGGVVGSNTVGGFFGSAIYRSWITCKTQLNANGSYVRSKLNAVNSDDRGALLWVGINSPTAATKGVWLALRPGQGANDKLRIGWNSDTTLAAADPPAAFSATDDWRFEWKKVGSDYVYRGLQNGVVAITFTDTNGATLGVPGRYVAIGSTVIQINFNNYQATNGFTGLVTCGDNL